MNNKFVSSYIAITIKPTSLFILSVVNVSLASEPVNASESVGNTSVCVTLVASANTERAFSVFLNTEASIAIGIENIICI